MCVRVCVCLYKIQTDLFKAFLFVCSYVLFTKFFYEICVNLAGLLPVRRLTVGARLATNFTSFHQYLLN